MFPTVKALFDSRLQINTHRENKQLEKKNKRKKTNKILGMFLH